MNSILSYLTFTIPSSFIKQPYFLSLSFFLFPFSILSLSAGHTSSLSNSSLSACFRRRCQRCSTSRIGRRGCTTSLHHIADPLLPMLPTLVEDPNAQPNTTELQARRSVLPFTVELADPRHRPRQRPTAAFTSPTNQTARDRRHIASDPTHDRSCPYTPTTAVGRPITGDPLL
jgi:hypothetical protein